MKIDTKDKLKVILIMVPIIILVIYAFYVHKDEPHWFEREYVKIIK